MSDAFNPEVWTAQPPFPVLPAGPLAEGLVGVIVPAWNDGTMRVGTVAFGSVAEGVAVIGDFASMYGINLIPALGAAATLVVYGNLKFQTTLSGFAIAVGTSGAGSQVFAIQPPNDTTPARGVLRVVDAGGITTAESSIAGGVDTPDLAVYALTYNGTSLTIYKNGIDITSTRLNTAATGAMSSMDNVALNGVNRGTDAFGVTGQKSVGGYVYNRVLTPGELLALAENFWQVFPATENRLRLGSPGTTGTLATTNANDTLAASGSAVGFTGTLAKTNANDTLAGSGTQTNTGTLAKANANDLLAASGYIQANGTLATTNTSDTVSASGTAAGGDAGWLGPGPRAYDFLNPRRKNIELSPDPIEVVAKSIATGIVERAARKERDEGAYLAKVRAELDAHKIEIDRRELKKLRKQIKQRDDDETLTTLLMSMI